MTEERLDEIVKIAKSLRMFRDENGVIGWDGISLTPEVQMRHKALVEAFPRYHIAKREDSVYPFEVVALYGGVRFFGLMTNEDHDELQKVSAG